MSQTNDTYITKNHAEEGGDKWVIGGVLEILEGAQVTGLNAKALGISAKPIPDSTTATIANLKDDFNALIRGLRDAGLISK